MLRADMKGTRNADFEPAKSSPANVWVPSAQYIERAHVMELARCCDCVSYDELYRFSLTHPDKYWTAVNEMIGVRWSVSPHGYVDTRRSKEFPDWFPGGELNWVDTVIETGRDPARAAVRCIVAEHEDGTRSILDYGAFFSHVLRVAAGLRKLGVARGDRIGLLCEPGIEACVSILAVSALGGIVVPLFSGFGADAIISRLEPCGARAIIATTGFDRRGRCVNMVPVVQEAANSLSALTDIIWKDSAKAPAPFGAILWNDIASCDEELEATERMSANDPFMVMYTSGTTGKPKGVVHTHGGFPLKVAHDAMIHWDIGPGDAFFWPVDMGWVAGSMSMCAALMRGATYITYSGAPDFPDWSRMASIVESSRATHVAAAPTLIRGLAAAPDLSLKGDRSTVRVLITAGEGIDPDHFTWFRLNFGGPDVPLINSSGGTEVSGLLVSSVVVKPIQPASFNTASPGIVLNVVDPMGKPVTDEIGELAIHEPFVGMTRSFWNDDERYLSTYWESVPGVWVHGDLALQQGDGSFMLLGRSDDTLKVAGKRLGPAEVEEIVLEFDFVQEAAAIGIDDVVKGERLEIFAVVRPDALVNNDVASRKISDAVAARLGKAFRPRSVYFVGQLPKTKTSKIMRRLIKQICCGGVLGDLSSLDNPSALDEIRGVVESEGVDRLS